MVARMDTNYDLRWLISCAILPNVWLSPLTSLCFSACSLTCLHRTHTQFNSPDSVFLLAAVEYCMSHLGLKIVYKYVAPKMFSWPSVEIPKQRQKFKHSSLRDVLSWSNNAQIFIWDFGPRPCLSPSPSGVTSYSNMRSSAWMQFILLIHSPCDWEGGSITGVLFWGGRGMLTVLWLILN